jgi:hypothetical protein
MDYRQKGSRLGLPAIEAADDNRKAPVSRLPGLLATVANNLISTDPAN